MLEMSSLRRNSLFSNVIFKCTVLLFFFAPFVSLIFFTLTNNKTIAAIPAVFRDLVIIVTVFSIICYQIFIRHKLHKLHFFSVILVASLLISILFVDFQMIAFDEVVRVLINNIRRFVFPFLIFIYFFYTFNVKDISLIKKCIIAFWCFGIFEWLMPLSFWESLGLLNYWNLYSNSMASTGDIQEDLDGYHRLYTFDTYYIFGFKARRLISLYLEPTTTAALAQASIIFGLIFRNKTIIFLATICGVLTYSKGFLIFYMLLIPLVIFYNICSRRLLLTYVYAVTTTLFLMLLTGYFIYLEYPQIVKFGFFAHLEGLYEYFIHFNPVGYGIGNVGSFRFEDMWGGELHRVGVESSLANLISQLGILGFLAIYGFFIFLLIKTSSEKIAVYIIFSLCMYIFVYSTSNSATGYSGNFLVYILIVIAYKYGKYIESLYNEENTVPR